jgi:diketogulonate reductase-like aldo/keto reductase
VAALRRGIELGLPHIAAAQRYGDGTVEEMVAEAIEGRRDEVFLVSKAMSENATRRGTIRVCERASAAPGVDEDGLTCGDPFCMLV